MTTSWKRVTKANPCPVCKKNSWCAITTGAILCMRVASNRPKTLKSGELGWIHKDGTQVVPQQRQRKAQPELDCQKILSEWHKHANACQAMGMSRFADDLCVSLPALVDLGCVWSPDHHAWAFPMRNGDGKIVGIRLRSKAGAKWAVTGSRQGLFYPLFKAHPSTIWLVEGPTDTAAGLTIGLNTIGRPSCSGGMDDVRQYCRSLHVQRAVIVADKDDPGLNGATMLQRNMNIPSTVILLPAKDLRDYVKNGGTAELLDCELENAIWRNPHGQS